MTITCIFERDYPSWDIFSLLLKYMHLYNILQLQGTNLKLVFILKTNSVLDKREGSMKLQMNWAITWNTLKKIQVKLCFYLETAHLARCRHKTFFKDQKTFRQRSRHTTQENWGADQPNWGSRQTPGKHPYIENGRRRTTTHSTLGEWGRHCNCFVYVHIWFSNGYHLCNRQPLTREFSRQECHH